MDDVALIVILVVLALVVVAAVLLWQRKQQSKRLQERFGPEYDRTVEDRGGRREAERELAERQKEREALKIRDLDPVRQQEYAQRWRDVQTRFVDEPDAAVAQGHELVREVMHERGYPTEDMERQADLVSVDHPEVVRDYRAANEISGASRQGQATTEQLRQAMVHYRSLFSRLLDSAAAPTDTTGERGAR